MSQHPDKTFDLTREGWLPCLDKDGKPIKQLLSLHEVFEQAHEITDIYGDNPLVDAALYRLLLAILHRNFQNTKDKRWEELWNLGCFHIPTLNAYFEEWQDKKERFYLYHPEHPFYQTHSAFGKEGAFDKGVAELMKEIAMGSDATLFDHNVHHDDIDEGNRTLDLPTTARMLIATQGYKVPGTGAGPYGGKNANSYPTAPFVEGIQFFAKGRRLFETLMLNLIEMTDGDPFQQTTADCPSWERDDPFTLLRSLPDGYLDYLTWQTCRVLLDVPIESPRGKVVRNAKMSLGLPSMDGNARKNDPFKAYDADSDGNRTKAMTWKSERALWRDSSTLFNIERIRATRSDKAKFSCLPPRILEKIVELPVNKASRYSCSAIGMLSDKARIDFYRREEMPLPLEALTSPHLVEGLDSAIEYAERVADKALKNAADKTVESYLEGNSKSDEGDVGRRKREMKSLIEERYWPNLSAPFYQFFDALRTTNDIQVALDAWRKIVVQVAYRALDEVTRGIGDTARAHKARVRAMQAFNTQIIKLNNQRGDANV